MARLAQSKHGHKVVIINIKKLSSVADYLVVCSAQSERQVQAISEAIEDGLRKKGTRPMGVEGATGGRWALIDCNDVVAHVFYEPVRALYDIEGLWAEAPIQEMRDKARKKSAKGSAEE